MYSVWDFGDPVYSSNSLEDCLDYCLSSSERDVFIIKFGDVPIYKLASFDGFCSLVSVDLEG